MVHVFKVNIQNVIMIYSFFINKNAKEKSQYDIGYKILSNELP